MVVSLQTIDSIIEVVRRHVDEDTFKLIVADLLKVQGNRSFHGTINNLARRVLVDK